MATQLANEFNNMYKFHSEHFSKGHMVSLCKHAPTQETDDVRYFV